MLRENKMKELITIETVANGFILTLIETRPQGYVGAMPFGEQTSEAKRVYPSQEDLLKAVKTLTE